MKTFKSYDSCVLTDGRTLMIIKRPNAYAPKENLPKDGEVVSIDDKEVEILKAYYMGDSEFNYWPDIVIEIK